MDIVGKRVIVLGLAREGISLARFLVQHGATVTVTDVVPAEQLAARVTALEDLSARFVLGGDHPELIAGADLLFVSPGAPESNPVYQTALRDQVPIQSMTTLFFDLCPGQIIGITGSSGKTTTTALIGEMLRTSGRDVVVGGNIGDPMLDLLPHVRAGTWVVLELSSFQLGLLRTSPHVAVVTNISPNHLDRHGTMERYIAAKRNIVTHQVADDYAVVNADDPSAACFGFDTPASVRRFGFDSDIADGATVQGDEIGVIRDGSFTPVMPVSDVPLLGAHNVANVLAALATFDTIAVELPAVAGAVRSFRPAPHRLEIVAERDGVLFVDDSIATSPARAVVALQAFRRPVLLIAGGRDKCVPWETFAQEAVQRVRALFLIGEAAPLIENAIRTELRSRSGLLTQEGLSRCSSLQEAVLRAASAARPGDVVLLSPGCASYDMFADFESRGRTFARVAEALYVG